MIPLELYKFGIHQPFDNNNFIVGANFLPKQRVDGKVFLHDGVERCCILYKELINQGQYGLIQRCVRVTNTNTRAVIVKRPREPSVSLEPEAYLQHLCNYALESAGCHKAVPEVYDIFIFADEVRFSMEWVDGKSIMNFFYTESKMPTFEETFINCILQICVLLEILGRKLNFNHRDLTPNNLWIHYNPGAYVLDDMRIEFKYQVVLLDFGFACLGGERNVNLGNIIPQMDPCEKDGRDMYHLFSILLASPIIRSNISHNTLLKIHSWMKPYDIKEPYLTYLITSDKNFKLTSLKPMSILKSILLEPAQDLSQVLV